MSEFNSFGVRDYLILLKSREESALWCVFFYSQDFIVKTEIICIYNNLYLSTCSHSE